MTHAVAQFASAFSPHVGGVEQVVEQLAHQQLALGDNPLVITMRWPKDLAQAEVVRGIPVRRHIFRLPEKAMRSKLAYFVENQRVQRAVERQLRAHAATIIHIQCVSSNALYAMRAARSLQLPLVATLHGELTMDATGIYQRSTTLPSLLRRLMLEADAVTACSTHTLDQAQHFTGVDTGARGSVICPGVTLAEFETAEPERRARPFLLAVGRHVRAKGFDVLIEAYAAVRSRLPDAPDLVIAGDGEERDALTRLVDVLRLRESIELVGECDRARTAGLFRGCSAFVLPSRHEPLGIVNMEAMAASKPVIASRVGGVPEIVADDETGLLTAPGDPAGLADAILRVITDPILAKRLGESGRLRMTAFDWREVSAQYDDVYRRATASAAQRIDQ